MRTLVIVHVDRSAAAHELLQRASWVPEPLRIVVTAVSGCADVVQRLMNESDHEAVRTAELRIMPTDADDDMAALLVGCSDLLGGDATDLIMRLITTAPVDRDSNFVRYFARFETESLLSSPGYVRNLLSLFSDDENLGMVFPPTPHIGDPHLGQGWQGRRDDLQRLCHDLGIRVPLDDVAPFAPPGDMWIARPGALRLLAARRWRPSDYAGADGARLGRVQRLAVAYAAGETGMHCLTATNAGHASLSHLSLEYMLDQLAATTSGYPAEQIELLHRAGWLGKGRLRDFIRADVRLNRPRVGRWIERASRAMRRSCLRVGWGRL